MIGPCKPCSDPNLSVAEKGTPLPVQHACLLKYYSSAHATASNGWASIFPGRVHFSHAFLITSLINGAFCQLPVISELSQKGGVAQTSLFQKAF